MLAAAIFKNVSSFSFPKMVAFLFSHNVSKCIFKHVSSYKFQKCQQLQFSTMSTLEDLWPMSTLEDLWPQKKIQLLIRRYSNYNYSSADNNYNNSHPWLWRKRRLLCICWTVSRPNSTIIISEIIIITLIPAGGQKDESYV